MSILLQEDETEMQLAEAREKLSSRIKTLEQCFPHLFSNGGPLLMKNFMVSLTSKTYVLKIEWTAYTMKLGAD